MEQMNVPEEMKLTVDFTDSSLPLSVLAFHPMLFRDGKQYCCILGPDLEKGVFGCGDSKEEAFIDWDKSFQLRLKSEDEDDEVATYIRDSLKTSPNKVW